DIEGGIRLGVAQALRFGEHRVEWQATRLHFGKNEVGGAIDDAGNPVDTVGGQAFANRLDDWNAASHGGLEHHHHALAAGSVKDLIAVLGQQRRVGGDHGLALADRLHDPLTRSGFAADEFRHDSDIRVARELEAVSGDAHTAAAQQPAPHFSLAPRHARHFAATSAASCDFVSVLLQYLPRTPEHHAQTEHADFSRCHSPPGSHSPTPSLRNLSLTPRPA